MIERRVANHGIRTHRKRAPRSEALGFSARGFAPARTPTASLAGSPKAPLRSAESLARARSFDQMSGPAHVIERKPPEFPRRHPEHAAEAAIELGRARKPALVRDAFDRRIALGQRAHCQS
jgi:hypothetical protein